MVLYPPPQLINRVQCFWVDWAKSGGETDLALWPGSLRETTCRCSENDPRVFGNEPWVSRKGNYGGWFVGVIPFSEHQQEQGDHLERLFFQTGSLTSLAVPAQLCFPQVWLLDPHGRP